jgi:hypothetical protein
VQTKAALMPPHKLNDAKMVGELPHVLSLSRSVHVQPHAKQNYRKCLLSELSSTVQLTDSNALLSTGRTSILAIWTYIRTVTLCYSCFGSKGKLTFYRLILPKE